MPDATVHEIFSAILIAFAGMFGVIGYLLQSKFQDDSVKHQKHFDHAADMDLHQTERDRVSLRDTLRLSSDELLRHTQQDDKRFDKIDSKMDKIGEDIKDILKAVAK